MTREYRTTTIRRAANAALSAALRLVPLPGNARLLATQGRKSGKIHVTPVNIITDRGQRWLVAPYGAVNWVKNVRANPRVQIRHGWRVESLEAHEVGAEERGAILKEYVQKVPIVRPYVHLKPDDPIERFVIESEGYPVFRLVEPDEARSD